MRATKYTPTPWYVRLGTVSTKPYRVRQEIRTTNGGIGELIAVLVAEDKSPDAIEANAALIVRAVNSHDVLVERLKRIVEAFDNDEGLEAATELGIDAEIVAARADIARATGEGA